MDSSIIQGPFSVAPCQTLISRFATFSSPYRSVEHFDAPLTHVGEQQCARLAAGTVAALKNVQLVVTSPMTRAVQTALLTCTAQQAAGVPFVALESVRETVNYVCDCRSAPNPALLGSSCAAGQGSASAGFGQAIKPL